MPPCLLATHRHAAVRRALQWTPALGISGLRRRRTTPFGSTRWAVKFCIKYALLLWEQAIMMGAQRMPGSTCPEG
eukprot:354399-Chlamydomonas_euryale.AAC.5